jgi:protoporphyrinogen oxidase
MENLKYRFVIIGAGLSGLTTAYELSKIYRGDVIVLEKDAKVGGLCKTIRLNNASYDLGSHRIHWDPRTEPFELIKDICAGAVIKNIRRGRLRIKNSYIAFPITSFQFFCGIGLIELFLCAVSLFKNRLWYKFIKKDTSAAELNYESYLIRKAGFRAYKLFYEPYAKKVWGCPPGLISIDAVKKRISMVKPTTQFFRYVFAGYFRRAKRNFYYYLNAGIGYFANSLEKRIIENDCRVITNVTDFSINFADSRKTVSFFVKGEEYRVEFDKLISTISIDDLVMKLSPEIEVCEMAGKIKWRGLRLIYLHVKGDTKIEGETFYFPELKYIFGRVSIPKRFAKNLQPDAEYTCFTCEVPCSEGDNLWNMPDKEIYDLCLKGLQKARLITKNQEYLSEKNFIVNIPKVYPIYAVGWKRILTYLLNYLSDKFPDIYASGKLGFFMHCNLDHSIDMGIFLAKYIVEGKSVKEWYSKAEFFHNMKLRD